MHRREDSARPRELPRGPGQGDSMMTERGRREGPADARRPHGPYPYRSPAISDGREPERTWMQRLQRIAPTVLVVIGIGLGLGYWVWIEGAQARAVAALPAAERARLFTRTLEDLRLCRAEAHQPALREFCEKQADLALTFPECTAECRALARLPWAGPTR